MANFCYVKRPTLRLWSHQTHTLAEPFAAIMQLCNRTVFAMWNSSSQVWFSDHPPPSPQGQNYFHNNTKKVGYVPSFQSWDRDWQWKSNGWLRTLSPNHGSGAMLYGGHSSSPEACSQKKPIYLKNVLQKAVTVIPITSSPLVHNLWWHEVSLKHSPLHTRHTAYL